jgi:PilZ domain
VSKENRKARRSRVSQPVLIVHANGSVIAPCMMVDVSASGARLKLSTEVALPSEFTLLLSKFNGNMCRRCAVVWRNQIHAGIRFLGEVTVAGVAS